MYVALLGKLAYGTELGSNAFGLGAQAQRAGHFPDFTDQIQASYSV